MDDRAQYGGTKVMLKDIEIDRRFYVHNGGWYGLIMQEDGIKYMYIEETCDTRLIDENSLNNYSLEIEYDYIDKNSMFD